MARGINRVTLIGNLGAEPIVRTTTSQSTVTNVSLATSESWRDKATGELQEKTEWHRVVFFGRLAEVVRDYCHKGSKIYVEGRIQTRKWTDKNGVERYTAEIIGNEMQMLDSRGNTPQQTPASSAKSAEQPAEPQAGPAGIDSPQTAPALSSTPGTGPDTFDDDDIPF